MIKKQWASAALVVLHTTWRLEYMLHGHCGDIADIV